MYGPGHQFETECDGRAVVCSRIRELQETLSAGTIALEISSRNARVQALQNRWDKMRRVIDERAASPDFADVPGGTTGLLCKDYKGKVADTVVYKVDTGLLAELRGHERQAAEELGQWKTRVEERKVIDASPAAMTLAAIFTTAELGSWRRRRGTG